MLYKRKVTRDNVHQIVPKEKQEEIAKALRDRLPGDPGYHKIKINIDELSSNPKAFYLEIFKLATENLQKSIDFRDALVVRSKNYDEYEMIADGHIYSKALGSVDKCLNTMATLMKFGREQMLIDTIVTLFEDNQYDKQLEEMNKIVGESSNANEAFLKLAAHQKKVEIIQYMKSSNYMEMAIEAVSRGKLLPKNLFQMIDRQLSHHRSRAIDTLRESEYTTGALTNENRQYFEYDQNSSAKTN